MAALDNVWCNPKGFRIEEIEGKLFHFFMDEWQDVNRILMGSPWIFRNSWLVIKEWQRDSDLTNLEFHKVPIWVQIWGLPPHYKTKQTGMKIGSSLGKVLDSALFEFPDKKTTIKVKVEVDSTKPIKTGVNIGSLQDGVLWVDFRYEKLPLFCFLCGIIGHGNLGCPKNQNLSEDTEMADYPFGPWLRTNIAGRIKADNQPKAGSSPKNQNGNQRGPTHKTSANIIKQFAKLSMQEKIKATQKQPNTAEKPNSQENEQNKPNPNNTKGPDQPLTQNPTNYMAGVPSSGVTKERPVTLLPTELAVNYTKPHTKPNDHQEVTFAAMGEDPHIRNTKRKIMETQHFSPIRNTETPLPTPYNLFLTAGPANQACREP